MTLLLLIAFFALMWVVPSVWVARSVTPAVAARRARTSFLILIALLMVVAAYWYVPLGAQNGLRALAATAFPQSMNLNCAQMADAREGLKATGQGVLVLEEDGTLRIKGEVWRALSAEQKRSIQSLADVATRCATGKVRRAPSVIDLDTSDALSSQ